ncbi:MAG: DUF3168 domain-containing protein [Paracoccaceae bacterium]
MSYGMAAALQEAVFQALNSDPVVNSLSAGAIFDALPSGGLPDIYVTLGPEDVRDRSDRSGAGAEHRFTVSVTTSNAGFATAKQLAAAITDVLVGAEMDLSRGRLVGLWFDRAVAGRIGTGGALRNITLRFRARVEDN